MNNRITDKHKAHLQWLEENGGLEPSQVLADAKKPKSPLHNLYDWDIKRAAEQYWLDRTREIIRTIQVVVHTDVITIEIPRYVRDPDAAVDEARYVETQSLRKDKGKARRLLTAEVERVLGVLQRSRKIAIGLGMVADFDDILERLTGLQSKVKTGSKVTPEVEVEGRRSRPNA